MNGWRGLALSLTALLKHAVEAHKKNLKLISFFSVPFLIAFPLSLLLPNFVALSGTFLRFRSVALNFTVFDALFIAIVFFVSLALFAFAVTAINVVVRAQRTLSRLTHQEVEKIEGCTYTLFLIFLSVFLVVLAANLAIFEYNFLGAAGPALGVFIAFLASLLVLFAPQAIVLEDLGVRRAIERSVNVIRRRFPYVLFFLFFAAFLVLLNSWVFLKLETFFLGARYIALVTNSLLILPFLEVLKVQIYLSKYTLL
ncbi:MAG: hypothetical protein QW343_02330 [Candidatus Norongarragalinales archaeon]